MIRQIIIFRPTLKPLNFCPINVCTFKFMYYKCQWFQMYMLSMSVLSTVCAINVCTFKCMCYQCLYFQMYVLSMFIPSFYIENSLKQLVPNYSVENNNIFMNPVMCLEIWQTHKGSDVSSLYLTVCNFLIWSTTMVPHLFPRVCHKFTLIANQGVIGMPWFYMSVKVGLRHQRSTADVTHDSLCDWHSGAPWTEGWNEKYLIILF